MAQKHAHLYVGSTGRPKAALLPHDGLANLIDAQRILFGVDSNSRVLQFASPSFDAFISKCLSHSVAARALVIEPLSHLVPGPRLEKTIADQRITHVTLPPTVLAKLRPEHVPRLRRVVVAGEACSASVAQRWASQVQLINAYGPCKPLSALAFVRSVNLLGNNRP
ncbi:MAG: AMP-binding protein [Pirellulaceae bacterium]